MMAPACIEIVKDTWGDNKTKLNNGMPAWTEKIDPWDEPLKAKGESGTREEGKASEGDFKAIVVAS